ncbi:Extradiol ring-cleavage dioxygenase, class III enzyme, subunit B [Fomitiporia mediterranea MF3/22]|uniref:Extradiol ring-cleavage dioxygenase, class III enzyme, subunit B n=1 Tax=Fomitiporia mediterranea (strain MF3/22) TaxID=694068 RepID=UPI0004408F5F|nr:Extradiol ring-cleavage dioxygenase, class III enzyme, subunit B [Fomitiporia mediterranea MF3/22]EJD05734.1 Extradiol ring-cleavage dioxygenase, class III enzyme, subunit B [Fomitiporia mediterranea MF3/22]
MSSTTTVTSPPASTIPKSDAEWKAALDALPSTPEKIPAFFFGHGSPLLQFPDHLLGGRGAMEEHAGPKGPLARFLKDFGPALLEKYKPKGILVFSAHWETEGERLVTDYGDDQPLLMDYFGFDREMYELQFSSNGSSELSQRVVSAFTSSGFLARTTTKDQARGQDGRGFNGPGLDHGVFIPFRIMFGHTFTDVPIIQASIDGNLSPEGNWAVGKAVAKLREEGILVLSGGLTIHTFQDWSAFAESTAKPVYKEFNQAILEAVQKPEPELKEALVNLTKHRGFRLAHPREEHFIPIYVAAGAGEGGEAKIVAGIYSAPTIAFGL